MSKCHLIFFCSHALLTDLVSISATSKIKSYFEDGDDHWQRKMHEQIEEFNIFNTRQALLNLHIWRYVEWFATSSNISFFNIFEHFRTWMSMHMKHKGTKKMIRSILLVALFWATYGIV